MNLRNGFSMQERYWQNFCDIWKTRLGAGWLPPAGSSYPFAQVRRSLKGLVSRPPRPINGEPERYREEVSPLSPPPVGRVPTSWVAGPSLSSVSLILAGNTPLLSWSPLWACLSAGVERIQVKMSRDEMLWTPLFVEALREVAPEMAERVELHVWPGDDPRTDALLTQADAVIAYGSDKTMATLRSRTPAGVPFYGFGHAVSVGLVLADADIVAAARGFAVDMLMYGQAGCLSPHTVFVPDAETAFALAEALLTVLPETADALDVPPVTDAAVARTVRQARDMALFGGFTVRGTDDLRGTVAVTRTPQAMPEPVGYGFLHIVPLDVSPEQIGERLGQARGIVSGVGIAGTVTLTLRSALTQEGVSYLCAPGAMQTPPIDWANGGIDLREKLTFQSG